MGKATITENKGAGRYTIEIDQGLEEKNKKIATLNDRRIELENKLFPLENRKATLEIEIQGELSANGNVATERYLRLTAEYDIVVTQIGYFKIQINSIARQISYYSTITGVLVKDAWCVDYTDQASGEVATIEVPDEPQLTLIAPGAVAPGPADGRILARAFQDPNQVYFNAAILPGVLKWRPNYRRGTINSVNVSNNTANVTLATAEMDSSDATKINLNISTELIGVPITYMSCNSAVFEPGDQVIVKFDERKWNQPKIIGFVNDPRQCSFKVLVQYRSGANFYMHKLMKSFEWDFISGTLNNGVITTGANTYTTNIFNRFELKTAEGGSKLYLAYYKPAYLYITSVYSGAVRVFLSPGKSFDLYYGGYLAGVSAKKHNGKWYVFIVARSFFFNNNFIRYELDPNLGVVDTQVLDTTSNYYKTDPTGSQTIPEGPYVGQKGRQYHNYDYPCEFNESCTIAKQPMYPQAGQPRLPPDPVNPTPTSDVNLSYDALTYSISGISVSKTYTQIGQNVPTSSLTPINPVFVDQDGVYFQYEAIVGASTGISHLQYEYVGDTLYTVVVQIASTYTTILNRYIPGYWTPIDNPTTYNPPTFPPEGGSFEINTASRVGSYNGTIDYGFGVVNGSGNFSITNPGPTSSGNGSGQYGFLNYWNPKAQTFITSTRPVNYTISNDVFAYTPSSLVVSKNNSVVFTSVPETLQNNPLVFYNYGRDTRDCGALGKWYGLYFSIGTFYTTISLPEVQKIGWISFGNDGIDNSAIENAFGGFYEPHPSIIGRWIRSVGDIGVVFEQ